MLYVKPLSPPKPIWIKVWVEDPESAHMETRNETGFRSRAALEASKEGGLEVSENDNEEHATLHRGPGA